MDVIKNKINWFPGHMKKALDQIKEKTKFVDLFIEVVDSRCLSTSSNDELVKLANNKPILTIALKEDLSSLSSPNNQANKNLIIGNIKNKNFKQLVIKKLYEILDDKIKRLKTKGLVNPKFLIMIVGLPNVGKSSLINLLKNKNMLEARNQPGVTKNQRIVNINENFDLIDTPGILFKNISNLDSAYKLSLINCIKKEVLPVEEVLKYGFNYLKENNYQELLKYYKLDNVNDYYDFYQQICLKNNYLLPNQEFDNNRFETNIYNDFTMCKIAKVNYDK